MTQMDKPALSPNFTMEDIRKLRDYNSIRRADMTLNELREDLRPNIEAFEKLAEERKQKRKLTQIL